MTEIVLIYLFYHYYLVITLVIIIVFGTPTYETTTPYGNLNLGIRGDIKPVVYLYRFFTLLGSYREINYSRNLYKTPLNFY